MKRALLILFASSFALASVAWYFTRAEAQFGSAPRIFTSAQVGADPQDGYILSTNGSSSTWIANTGGGGGASSTIIQINDATVNTGVPTLDFGSGITISESPTDEFNISVPIYLGTSSTFTTGNLAFVTGAGSVGSVATGTLTETVSGLELSATRGLVGGSSILSLTSGFVIPTSTLWTNVSDFYQTPSTRITAGTNLSWSGNTLNATGGSGAVYLASSSPWTAGDAAFVAGDGTLGSVATGTLTETVSGLELSATRGLFGGSSILSLTNGFTIPSSTLITSASAFHASPSSLCTAITGNAGLCDGVDDTASAGSGLATTAPWTVGQLAQVASGGAVSSIATSALALAISDTVGTLTETRGGTNQTAYATGDLLYASSANTLTRRAIGTTGQVLMVSGGLPTWTSTSSLGLLAPASIDTSAELATILTDETGTSGGFVRAGAPTLTGTTTLANASVTNLLTTGLRVTATTTLSGYTRCGSGTPPALEPAVQTLLDCWGNDADGAYAVIGNTNNSTNAYSALLLNNNDSKSDGSNYGGLLFYSTNYNNTAFGTFPDQPNALSLENSMGPILLMSGTTSNSYIALATGGVDDENERLRITSNGNIGIGTTSPSARLDITGTVGSTLLRIVNSVGTVLLSAVDNVVTALGAWDFGGANSLEIPNGTNPTVDATGEIAVDTTSNEFIIGDNANTARVMPFTDVRIWSVTIASTSDAFISGGLLPVGTHLDGYTITRIQCHVTGGTSKVIAVEDASANSSEDITCGTTNTTDDGSITNATYTASELPFIDFGATTGAVNYVTISVFGNWTGN